MKKILKTSLLGFLALFLFSCAGNIQAEANFNLVKQELQNVRYAVPETWQLQAATQDSEAANQYTFDGGLLQVDYTATTDKIADDTVQANFISALQTQLGESATIDNKQAVTVDLTPAYQYDIKFTDDDGTNYVGNLLLIDLDGGYISFLFLSNASSDYSSVFPIIRDSISTPIFANSPTLQTTPQNNTAPAMTSNYDASTQTYKGALSSIKVDSIDALNDFYDNPALKISFTLTNNSDQPQVISNLLLSQLNIVQDSNPDVTLSPAVLTDGNFNLNDILQPGQSVSGSYAVSLTSQNDPVLIQFRANPTATIDHTMTFNPSNQTITP